MHATQSTVRSQLLSGDYKTAVEAHKKVRGAPSPQAINERWRKAKALLAEHNENADPQITQTPGGPNTLDVLADVAAAAPHPDLESAVAANPHLTPVHTQKKQKTAKEKARKLVLGTAKLSPAIVRRVDQNDVEKRKAYSAAFKEGTLQYWEIVNTPGRDTRGQAQKIARAVGAKHDTEISYKTIQRHGSAENTAGHSPPQMGPKSLKIPKALTGAMGTYAQLNQLAGQSKRNKPRTLAQVATVALSPYIDAGKFSSNKRKLPDQGWLRRRIARDNCVALGAKKVKNVQSKRFQWVTYDNLNEWGDGWKKCLLDLGMAASAPAPASPLPAARPAEEGAVTDAIVPARASPGAARSNPRRHAPASLCPQMPQQAPALCLPWRCGIGAL